MTQITRLTRLIAYAVLLTLVLALGRAEATSHGGLNLQQVEEVQQIIRNYLRDNPEIIIEALQVLQARERARDAQQNQQAVVAERAELVNDPDTPIGGNPDGDVTVVEFFDYQCPYCKRVAPSIAQLLAEDAALRFAYKELPILGESSIFAARMALAIHREFPGAYEAYHMALMQSRGQLSEQAVRSVVKQLDLDLQRLEQGMNSAEVSAVLQRNLELARRLGISGTPAFIIGDELIPGAVSLANLRALVARAREGG